MAPLFSPPIIFSRPSALPEAFASTASPVTVAVQHPHMNPDGTAEEIVSLDSVFCLNHTPTSPPS